MSHLPLSSQFSALHEMASQRFGNFPSSPPNKRSKAKRSRSKRRSEDDADNSRAKNKRSKDLTSLADGHEPEVEGRASDASRPKRSGAGSGGRVMQLEKIGMVLEKPLVTARPRQLMDIADDLPDNPLAPPKKQKQRKAKVSLW